MKDRNGHWTHSIFKVIKKSNKIVLPLGEFFSPDDGQLFQTKIPKCEIIET